MVELAMVQVTGNMRAFVQFWTGDEVANGTGGEVTHVVEVPSKMERCLCVDCW